MFVPIFVLFIAGCTTPGKQTTDVYDKAPESEKAKFNSSENILTKLDECAKETKGNDVQFTLKRAPLLNNKDIFVIFYEAKAYGSSVSIITENGKSSTFECEVGGKNLDAKKIASLKKEDRIVINGKVKDYSWAKYNKKSTIPFAPDEETTGHKITLTDCKVKS